MSSERAWVSRMLRNVYHTTSGISSGKIGLSIRQRVKHWPCNTMSSTSPTAATDTPDDLHTAEEIAAFLKVDPKTVLNWAKDGIIPEAFRVGRTVRFSLDAVRSSLDVNCAGDGRSVELAVMALSLVIGPSFRKIPKVDLGSITVDEVAELRRLYAAYSADLDKLETPEECAAYAVGALEAARMVARGV